jgi:hypothetical protein
MHAQKRADCRSSTLRGILASSSDYRFALSVFQVLYELNGVEQSYVTHRLGFPVAFDKKHTTMHYRLDCNNPEHRTIAQVGAVQFHFHCDQGTRA